jgi:hypothetical protein
MVRPVGIAERRGGCRARPVLSGKYNVPDAWITSNRVWREIILTNLRGV